MSSDTNPVLMEYYPPEMCMDDRCRDMFMEFIYCIVVPGGILFLVTLIFCVALCCIGCKRKKKDSSNDETQMSGYNSIRRASLTLRSMSQKRDTPLLMQQPDRSGSLSLDREHRYRRGIRGRDTANSAPGTLQRDRRSGRQNRDSGALPPEYRIPPGYLQMPADSTVPSGVQYSELQQDIPPGSIAQERLVS
ncbi:hypothetical protein CHS0354_041187 [Potamilus streckersoni]|uniref:Uncharacterized protein n=1 Tax=Potamilus streckersoni TaxID=2493646 RepID=A0AAE0SDX2_9BIVA|nr:hypothetical protein CHS0354_041187 [Potamilus streckersoni]